MATIVDDDTPATPIRFEVTPYEQAGVVRVFVKPVTLGRFQGGYLAEFKTVERLDALIDALIDARATVYPSRRLQKTDLEVIDGRLSALESYVFGEVANGKKANGT